MILIKAVLRTKCDYQWVKMLAEWLSNAVIFKSPSPEKIEVRQVNRPDALKAYRYIGSLESFHFG